MTHNTRRAEMQVLAAIGGIVVAGNDGQFGTRQPTVAEVRGRALRLTDREFADTLRRLVQTGAVVRSGRGNTATMTRDLSVWNARRSA